MQEDGLSPISADKIEQFTQASLTDTGEESSEHIIASTMLTQASIAIKAISAKYAQTGVIFIQGKDIIPQIPEEDRETVSSEIGKGALAISVMALEKAKKTGQLTDRDITVPYNQAFGETIMPSFLGNFTYVLSKKERNAMQDMVEKRDRTYGTYFTDEFKSLLPPIREFILRFGWQETVAKEVSKYREADVNMVIMRAKEMEQDLKPPDPLV